MFIKDRETELIRKYRPKNDFCVWFKIKEAVTVPLVIGEVVSNVNESDRYRMLLQAVALARLVPELCTGSTEQLFIVAIYLTKKLTADRYILMKSGAETDQVVLLHY